MVETAACCDVGGSCRIGKVIVSGEGGCSSDEEDNEGICSGGEAWVGRWLEVHAGEHVNICGVDKRSRF